jgi:hypothetical protein
MMKSLFLKSVFSLTLVFGVFGFGRPGSAQAQATLQVSSTTSVLTKTGHTELLGSVTFTVSSGTTVNGRIEVFLPNITLTNTVASGITLTGTGGLATATIANVVGDSGIIIINTPPGAGLGSTVTLSGIRISAAGKTFTTLDAATGCFCRQWRRRHSPGCDYRQRRMGTSFFEFGRHRRPNQEDRDHS